MLRSLPALLLGTFSAGALLCGVRAQTIHEWPPTKVQPMGSPLSLECTVKGTSNPNLYWYRQAAGGPLQLLFYSFGVRQVESLAPLNLDASRPEDHLFILSSEKPLLNDSGLSTSVPGVPHCTRRGRPLCKNHTLPSTRTTTPRGPRSGAQCRVFATGFLAASQCESS